MQFVNVWGAKVKKKKERKWQWHWSIILFPQATWNATCWILNSSFSTSTQRSIGAIMIPLSPRIMRPLSLIHNHFKRTKSTIIFDPYTSQSISHHINNQITLVCSLSLKKTLNFYKVPNKYADGILIFFFFFRENKIWHFKWIICKAEHSHELWSLITHKNTKKKKKKNENVVCCSYDCCATLPLKCQAKFVPDNMLFFIFLIFQRKQVLTFHVNQLLVTLRAKWHNNHNCSRRHSHFFFLEKSISKCCLL